MRARQAICVALLTMSVAPTLAAAKTIFVNNTLGSDRTTGLSAQPQAENGPLQTLCAALARAERADRIELANTGVPYRESLSLSLPQHSGYRDKPFVVEGNGATLDGTVAPAWNAWRHVEGNVFAFRPRRLTYQQVFDRGQPLTRFQLLSRYEVNQIPAKQWALFDGKIYFRTEDGKIPADYELRHAGLQTGVTLYMVRHVRIQNLVVQGFQQDGINAHELVRDCTIVDVDSRANGRAGLSVGGVSRVLVERSNFYDNGRVQVRTEGLAEIDLVDCEVDDATAPAYSALGRVLEVNGTEVSSP